jgi:hypothetical protein
MPWRAARCGIYCLLLENQSGYMLQGYMWNLWNPECTWLLLPITIN